LVVALAFIATFLVSLIIVKLFFKKNSGAISLPTSSKVLQLTIKKDSLNADETKDLTKVSDDHHDGNIFDTHEGILTTER
jgi:hypothetical protein